MLSYRHAFHAGNHADVLKHTVELFCLRYMTQKDKPFWYADTHAGAGYYALDEGYATQLAEYVDGIGRLWQRDDLPEAVADYVEAVRELNQDGQLRVYPGSPAIALHAIRPDDRMRLFELHSSDSELLRNNFAYEHKQVSIEARDGFNGLKSVLPPPPRRGLVLIDPPYEDKRDYQTVVKALREGLKRFATGTFAVWFPHLGRAEPGEMAAELRTLPCKSWLEVGLRVHTPSADGFGMHGSSMFVINPPWTLKAMLEDVMPWLTDVLAQDDGAQFLLESGEN